MDTTTNQWTGVRKAVVVQREPGQEHIDGEPLSAGGEITYEYTLPRTVAVEHLGRAPGDDVLLTCNWSRSAFRGVYEQRHRSTLVRRTARPWAMGRPAPFCPRQVPESTICTDGCHRTAFRSPTPREDRHRTVLSDSLIENVTGCGLGVQGSDITVQRTTMQKCGEEGFVILDRQRAGDRLQDSEQPTMACRILRGQPIHTPAG